MSLNLDNEPQLIWKHFLALSAIPRASKEEKRIAEYVMNEARRMGLDASQDAVGNIVVRKKATAGKEGSPVTVLQGHLDLVCEKNEGNAHDFSKDPLTLVRDGEFIRADGTTLGADNGIGVAAALAVMEASDLAHGPLEMLFTIDEETGMTGAFGLQPGSLKGTRLLNLDTEEEGAIYIGCAGGMDSVASRKVRRVAPGAGKKAFRLKISGLKGGHSGLEIAEGRGNALKLLARTLQLLMKSFDVEVASLSGGSKRNAIAREAFATLVMDPAKLGAANAELARLQGDFRAELGAVDPGAVVQLEPLDAAPAQVFAAEDARLVVGFLYACLHGTLAMTPGMPELVQTSTNLAIIDTQEDLVKVSMSHRSSIDSAKKDVGNMIATYCELLGFEITQGSGYPGWKPNLNSELLKTTKEIHRKLFGNVPVIKAVHAGLECGLIGEKFPGMDMISFGPTITGAHSPDEKVSVKSVGNFWAYLKAILAEL